MSFAADLLVILLEGKIDAGQCWGFTGLAKNSWQINGVGMKHFKIMSDRDRH